MKTIVKIDRAAAILSGQNVNSDTVEIDIAVESLNLEQRKLLAELFFPPTGEIRKLTADTPTAAGLLAAMQIILDERAAAAAEKKKIIEQIEKSVLSGETEKTYNNRVKPLGFVSYGPTDLTSYCSTGGWDRPGYRVREEELSPVARKALKELLSECWKKNAQTEQEEKAETALRNEAYAKERLARERREEEAAALKLVAHTAIIDNYGTPIQQERVKRGKCNVLAEARKIVEHRCAGMILSALSLDPEIEGVSAEWWTDPEMIEILRVEKIACVESVDVIEQEENVRGITIDVILDGVRAKLCYRSV